MAFPNVRVKCNVPSWSGKLSMISMDGTYVMLFSQFVMFRCGLSPVDLIHIRSAYAIDTGAEAIPGNIGEWITSSR